MEDAASEAGLAGTDLNEVTTASESIAKVMYEGITTLESTLETLDTANAGSLAKLTEMAEAAVVAQDNSATAITAAVDAVEASDTSQLSSLVASYSGASLTAALDAAVVDEGARSAEAKIHQGGEQVLEFPL